MDSKFILALDIGTSSVRASLYHLSGEMLDRTLVKNERTLTITDDGGAEIDAREAFDQVAVAIDDVMAKAARIKGDIVAVAASSFWHSLMGVDTKGTPTTKVLSWADTRSREQTALLKRRFDEGEIHNRTGARFHSSFWPSKLLWLKKTHPKAFSQTDKWLSLSDYVVLQLSDKPLTSVSMASATGIFNIRECEWDVALMKYLGVKRASVPAIAAEREAFVLNAKFAERWPRLKSAHWFPAIGDGAANNIGAGCVKRNKAALMIGTSGAMRVAYKGDPPTVIPSGLWCYRIDRNRVIIGGALSDGGGLYQWLKDNLRLGYDDDTIENEIAKRKPASHGLVFLPFLAGERSTGYRENARGAVIGLSASTDATDITQAAVESVAYRFASIFDQIKSIGPIRQVIASGGALRESPVWTHVICDVLGRDLTLPDTREASSRGSVLLILETLGKIKSIENIPTPGGRRFTLDKERTEIYRVARREHEKLYRALIENQIHDSRS